MRWPWTKPNTTRSLTPTEQSIWFADTRGIIYLVCSQCGGDFELRWDSVRSSIEICMAVACTTCGIDMTPVPWVEEVL